MKEIPLTQGKVALIDDEDFAKVAPFRWHFHAPFYAMRKTKRAGGQQGFEYIHQLIMGKREGHEIDHRDLNGLNNTRSNLRFATHAQNKLNQGRTAANTSGAKGVCWCKKRGKWLVQIRVQGRVTHVGYFVDFGEAVRAYAAASLRHYGEFSRT